MMRMSVNLRCSKESMMRFSVCWFIPLVLSLFTSCVFSAENDRAAFSARYPAGSILSVEQANKALEDVNLERDHVTEEFLSAKDICLHKFFVNACLDKVKERRRLSLKAIREVEVEANAFLRKEKAAERDRNVAERMRKDESAESSANRIIVPLPDVPRRMQPNKPVSKP